QGLLVYAALAVLLVFDSSGFRANMQNFGKLKAFITEKQNLALLIFALVSLMIPFLISQWVPIYVENRYTIIALGPWTVLIGAALRRFANKGLVFVFCLSLLGGVTAAFLHRRTRPDTMTFQSMANFLAERAKNNDLLVFATSSRAPMDYYLSLRRPGKFSSKISFPFEMAVHSCWTDVEKMVSDKGKLEREADSVVRAAGNGRIWLVKGGYKELDDFIAERLDAHLLRLSGKEFGEAYTPFQQEILVYQKYRQNFKDFEK
ncbi:MAG: hypothetical protein ACRECJ_07625, partial [Limisphaerales bacterium]